MRRKFISLKSIPSFSEGVPCTGEHPEGKKNVSSLDNNGEKSTETVKC